MGFIQGLAALLPGSFAGLAIGHVGWAILGVATVEIGAGLGDGRRIETDVRVSRLERLRGEGVRRRGGSQGGDPWDTSQYRSCSHSPADPAGEAGGGKRALPPGCGTTAGAH